MLVMGGIVGSGIFMNPSVVARQVHTPFLILGAWVAGGVLALLGAFIVAQIQQAALSRAKSPYRPPFYLYLDEGSSFITVRDNWCPAEKFMKNANGPGNVWTNNGPATAESVRNSAGLEAPFQDLLRTGESGVMK